MKGLEEEQSELASWKTSFGEGMNYKQMRRALQANKAWTKSGRGEKAQGVSEGRYKCVWDAIQRKRLGVSKDEAKEVGRGQSKQGLKFYTKK